MESLVEKKLLPSLTQMCYDKLRAFQAENTENVSAELQMKKRLTAAAQIFKKNQIMLCFITLKCKTAERANVGRGFKTNTKYNRKEAYKAFI